MDAFIPAATSNDAVVKTQDDVIGNNLLKTAKSGRVRASLNPECRLDSYRLAGERSE